MRLKKQSRGFAQPLRAQAGFTLIELLVVIAIIGVLSSVVLASLNSAREKARDARRVADLKQISLALELYYDSYGEYPDATGCHSYSFPDGDSLSGGDTWISVSEFMPSIPKDPLNTSNDSCPETWDSNESVYSYFTSADQQRYELLAPLERSDNALRCDQVCYESTVYAFGQSWCAGATNQCSSPFFTDSRGQHMYVVNGGN